MLEYGIGNSLFFKFTKAIAIVMWIGSFFAMIPMAYYYSTSAWSANQQAAYLAVNKVQYGAFFTSIGSLGGASFVCGSADEGERLVLSCQSGVLNRLEVPLCSI